MPRFFQSFQNALAGVTYVVQTQRNAKIHLGAALVISALVAWLRIPLADAAIIILTIGMVLALEMLNTLVETLVDLVSPERHPLAGTAKDIAAGAVLISAMVAVAVGLFLLGPPLYKALFQG
jgi:diacylglycerol kinase